MDKVSQFWTEQIVSESYVADRIFHVDLSYPRCGENPNCVQVGLSDVRAADDIRIRYDFERDGWVIEQNAHESHETVAKELDDWQEVAFVRAWARMVRE